MLLPRLVVEPRKDVGKPDMALMCPVPACFLPHPAPSRQGLNIRKPYSLAQAARLARLVVEPRQHAAQLLRVEAPVAFGVERVERAPQLRALVLPRKALLHGNGYQGREGSLTPRRARGMRAAAPRPRSSAQSAPARKRLSGKGGVSDP